MHDCCPIFPTIAVCFLSHSPYWWCVVVGQTFADRPCGHSGWLWWWWQWQPTRCGCAVGVRPLLLLLLLLPPCPLPLVVTFTILSRGQAAAVCFLNGLQRLWHRLDDPKGFLPTPLSPPRRSRQLASPTTAVASRRLLVDDRQTLLAIGNGRRSCLRVTGSNVFGNVGLNVVSWTEGLDSNGSVVLRTRDCCYTLKSLCALHTWVPVLCRKSRHCRNPVQMWWVAGLTTNTVGIEKPLPRLHRSRINGPEFFLSRVTAF